MIGQVELLWLGSIGIILLFGGLLMAVPRYQIGESSLPGFIAFGFSLPFWSFFTIHSLGYMVYDGGSALTRSASSLAVIGVLGAIVSVLLLFDGAMRMLR